MKIVYVVTTLIVSLFLGTVAAILFQPKDVTIESYPMTVNVIEEELYGINADPDGFYFGSLQRGGSGRRPFIINNVEQDILIHIEKTGEMAQWVKFPNDFILRKGEERTIDFSISIPENAPIGEYSGEIIVELQST